MKLLLSDIAAVLGAETPGADREVTGYSIDSRSLEPGDLFFALRGPRHDGHSYVAAALSRGAAAAVVSAVWSASADRPTGPLVPVEEPAEALRLLAAEARRRWGRPVVAVTGSNGKTTTKEVIAALLATQYRVSKSEGNLNNELGLPLSLLRVADNAEVAVVEMGMNRGGEIRQLAGIASPTVGIVTNVNAAHLEFFASVDEIALAKRELIESLPADGTAVLNTDDERVRGFAGVHPGRTVTFGFAPGADFQAVAVESRGARGTEFVVRSDGGNNEAAFSTALVGRHNVLNVLAGIATASVFGLQPGVLVDAVARLKPASMRGEVQQVHGVLILDDCYNANPAAAVAMLGVLRETPATRRIAVLGEMLELGPESEDLHRDVGRAAARSSLAMLVAVRGQARHIAHEAARAGLAASSIHFFEDAQAAGDFLAALVRPEDAVLLKASRGVGLERALQRLLASIEARAFSRASQ